MTSRTWADNDTTKPLSAARMNGIEADITANTTAAAAAQTTANAALPAASLPATLPPTDGSVTKPKLSATGGTAGQVLSTDGTALTWVAPSSGSGTTPADGSVTQPKLSATGTGTTGKVLSTDGISLAWATPPVTLPPTDGSVTKPKLSATGGAAGQVLGTDGTALTWVASPVDGAVTKPKLSASGGTAGQVLSTDGTALNWLTPGVADGAVTKPKLSALGGTPGQVLATPDGTALAWVTATGLTATTIKTAAYTAAPAQFVPVNTTTAGVTITLPTAPTDGSQIEIKQVLGGNATTILAAGGDVFNAAGGATTLTLSAVGIGVSLRYQTSGAIWHVHDFFPIAAVAGSYAPSAGPVPAAYAAANDARFTTIPPTRATADRTLALADAGTKIEAEAATALTFTVPPAATIPWPDGTSIEVMQTGAGQAVIAPGTGVTLRIADLGLKTPSQWKSVWLYKRGGAGVTIPTTNLLADWNADSIAQTNNTPVTSWAESSGNGLPAAVQATATNQPVVLTNIINGHKAVAFDGTNDFLSLSGAALDVARNRSALTIFVVYVHPSAVSGTRNFLALSGSAGGTTSRLVYAQRDATTSFPFAGTKKADSNTSQFIAATAASPVATPAVSTATWNYGASTVSHWLNGAASGVNLAFQAADTTHTTTDNTSSAVGVIGSGADSVAGGTTSTNACASRIARILIYGTQGPTLNTAVHTTLQQTYGITMADSSVVADEWVVSGGAA